MVEVSKFLVLTTNVGNSTCSELIHPWCKECFSASIDMMKSSLLGSFKFFGTIYGFSYLVSTYLYIDLRYLPDCERRRVIFIVVYLSIRVYRQSIDSLAFHLVAIFIYKYIKS